MARNNSPHESQEQMALFQWVGLSQAKIPELRLLHHIPNGGSRNVVEAHNLRLQGVRKGVPDICLPVPSGQYHGLYIELKRRIGGAVSDEQRGWLDALNRMGYRAVVCKGWESARDEILRYLHES